MKNRFKSSETPVATFYELTVNRGVRFRLYQTEIRAWGLIWWLCPFRKIIPLAEIEPTPIWRVGRLGNAKRSASYFLVGFVGLNFLFGAPTNLFLRLFDQAGPRWLFKIATPNNIYVFFWFMLYLSIIEAATWLCKIHMVAFPGRSGFWLLSHNANSTSFLGFVEAVLLQIDTAAAHPSLQSSPDHWSISPTPLPTPDPSETAPPAIPPH